MPEDYYLDKQQREYLLKDLATILAHTKDLNNVLTRQTRYHGQGRHSAESPLPFSVKASDLQHELAIGLPSICETLGYTTPFAHTIAIVDCLTWLSRNHMKLAAYEDAEKLADDIASWAHRIVAIVDRPKYPNCIGVCPECGESIYSYHDRGEITCTCGAILDIATIKAMCIESLERKCFTREVIRGYLTDRGIPDRTQRQWLQEIQPLNYEGKNYWNMYEITDRVDAWIRSKKARKSA